MFRFFGDKTLSLKEKKSLIKNTEKYLLGNNQKKNYSKEYLKKLRDCLPLYGLTKLSMEMKRSLSTYKIKPKNEPESYALEIKKSDQYLG